MLAQIFLDGCFRKAFRMDACAKLSGWMLAHLHRDQKKDRPGMPGMNPKAGAEAYSGEAKSGEAGNLLMSRV